MLSIQLTCISSATNELVVLASEYNLNTVGVLYKKSTKRAIDENSKE